jgi:hypothetical protein
MITPNGNINDNTLNIIIFEGQNVIISKCRGYYHFSGVNVIIFEGLDVIIFKCRGCYHFSWCQCYHFWSPVYYHFGVLDVIILSVEDVIIFHGALGIIFFIKVSKCYHFCGIIFRVLSFILTPNDNIKITQNMFKGK